VSAETLPVWEENETAPEDRFAFLGRLALAALLCVYAFLRLGQPLAVTISLAATAFVALDIIRFRWLERHIRNSFAEATVIVLQVAIVGGFFILPRPFGTESAVAARVALDTPLFMLLVCVLASNAAAAKPILLWVNGLAILGIWIVLRHFILSDPQMLTSDTLHPARFKTLLPLLQATNDAHYFNFGLWFKGGVIPCALITAALGLALYRTRELALTGAAQEIRRRSLATFFSPNLVDVMVRGKRNDFAPGEKELVVLDCDLVGFTSRSETMSPERVAGALQVYRSALEDIVFDHDGAILSHEGDGAVALFGLTGDQKTAAAKAFACSLAIARQWPVLAKSVFERDVSPIAIGIDVGPIFIGLVGNDRSLSLLAAGTAIDGASLLQQQTREADARILISAKMRGMLEMLPLDITISPHNAVSFESWRVHVDG
jgi:class 3 adenylate cyclase